MHRFYAEGQPDAEGQVTLGAEDSRHAARVLRLRAGDRVEVFLCGDRWEAELVRVDGEKTMCRLAQRLPDTEAALRITLFQGIPKGNKLETILQKATEIGAHAVVPVEMERSVPDWKRNEAERKMERWQRIVREAAKQSGRSRPPEVGSPMAFSALPAALAGFEAAVVPWEEAAGCGLSAFCRAHPGLKSLAVIIGPEGGIARAEMSALQAAGVWPVTLGPRILRTETAGLACLSALLCLYGDME